MMPAFAMSTPMGPYVSSIWDSPSAMDTALETSIDTAPVRAHSSGPVPERLATTTRWAGID